MMMMADVADIQRLFAALGHSPGPADGIWGKLSRAALKAALADLAPATAMRTSPAGIAAIAAHEGFVPGPYLDSVGVWTAYLGHTAAAGDPDPAAMPRGMPADLDGALLTGMRLFREDLSRFEARVNAAIKVPVEQHEFDAAVSFDYNTGAIGRANWVRALNDGNRALAAEEIMNWSRPPEIIGRRRAEQRLFRDGVYPDAAMAVWPVNAAGKVTYRAIRTVGRDDLLAMLG